jgi:hypothetical protein
MKAGLSVFRSACMTTMDTTLGFMYFLFANCNTIFCHYNVRTCGPYTFTVTDRGVILPFAIIFGDLTFHRQRSCCLSEIGTLPKWRIVESRLFLRIFET